MTKPYHHGDLASALLAAAEAILEAEGPAGLTLRAIARRAGVSHMAPAHHFGDLSGLLSELAAVGYRTLSVMLSQAQQDPGARTLARATGQAYVAFAHAHPGMFQLMFRSDRLDFTRPSLAEASRSASIALMRSSSVEGAEQVTEQPALVGPGARTALSRMVFEWSVVHGFAMLLIDGRLEAVMGAPGCERDITTLLDDALATVS